MVSTYRTAIVGLSGIGSNRPKPAIHPSLGTQEPYSHAAAYAAVPAVDVVAVCDIMPASLEKFRSAWSDVWPKVHTYTDYRQMLEREQIDLLSIATPDHLHCQIVLDACQAGVKAIFCEKPLATTLAEADQMIAAAEAHNVVMSVNHTRRWWPGNLQALDVLHKGIIGPLKRIVMTGCSPRAMLFRNGTHALDRICFFAESEPVEVFGELDPGFETYGPRYAGDGGHDPKRDPGASAYIHFANGVRAFFNFSQEPVAYGETLLMGTDGWIRVGEWGRESPVEVAVMDSASGTLRRFFLPDERYSYQGMEAAVRELIGVLENGGTLLSSPREARKTVELILAILHSHHLGGVRIHLPLDETSTNPADRAANP